MTAPTDEQVRPGGARHLVPAPGPRRPPRRWMAVFSTLLAVVLVAAGALSYAGWQTVRNSRAGKSVSTVKDPTQPGFEAFLEPTPTMLLVHSSGGGLTSIAVLALSSGDLGGSVLLVPPATRLASDETALTLGEASTIGGSPASVQPWLQALLNLGLTEVAVVDDARWAELVAPVAPLVIQNPDAVGPFPAGTLSLAADQVGAYLAARAEGESDLARLARQELFFEAWAAAVAASPDPAAVPGEVDSGIGRFVRGLAAGPRRVETLPVIETPSGSGTRLDVDTQAASDLLPALVPFPTAGRPGQRVRVRLLDGTGDRRRVLSAAQRIAPAGSEVVVVGNADTFDHRTTEVRYHDPAVKGAAKKLRDALGAGRVMGDPRQTDTFDVTIVLGPDVKERSPG